MFLSQKLHISMKKPFDALWQSFSNYCWTMLTQPAKHKAKYKCTCQYDAFWLLLLFQCRMKERTKAAVVWATTAIRPQTSCFLTDLLPNITSAVLYLESTASKISRGYICAHSRHIRSQFTHRIFHVNVAGKRVTDSCHHKQTPLSPSFSCCNFNCKVRLVSKQLGLESWHTYA